MKTETRKTLGRKIFIILMKIQDPKYALITNVNSAVSIIEFFVGLGK